MAAADNGSGGGAGGCSLASRPASGRPDPPTRTCCLQVPTICQQLQSSTSCWQPASSRMPCSTRDATARRQSASSYTACVLQQVRKQLYSPSKQGPHAAWAVCPARPRPHNGSRPEGELPFCSQHAQQQHAHRQALVTLCAVIGSCSRSWGAPCSYGRHRGRQERQHKHGVRLAPDCCASAADAAMSPAARPRLQASTARTATAWSAPTYQRSRSWSWQSASECCRGSPWHSRPRSVPQPVLCCASLCWHGGLCHSMRSTQLLS